MSLYRVDRYEANSADPKQQLGFCDWVGGPTLSNVKGAIISGTTERRAARVTGEALNAWALPAQASIGGKTVKGALSCSDEGVYTFHPWHAP